MRMYTKRAGRYDGFFFLSFFPEFYSLDNVCLENSDSIKYLGGTIHKNMTWNEQIDSLIIKVNQRIGLLKRVKPLLP